MTTKEFRRQRARVAVLTRHRGSDHPDVADARSELAAEADRRSVDDPVQLARAARIVRAALARQRLTLAELTPPPTANPSSGPAA